MKRIIILAIATLLISTATMATPSEQYRAKSKSKIEKYLQKLPIDAAEGINYSYISANMLKGIFSFISNIADDSPLSSKALTETIGSIRYVKKFEASTAAGYSTLKEKAMPLLACDDETMGMNLLSTNSKDKETTIVYGNKENTLIIINNGETNKMTLTFIAGLSMEKLGSLGDSGINLNF